jgi:hypothetical protein
MLLLIKIALKPMASPANKKPDVAWMSKGLFTME